MEQECNDPRDKQKQQGPGDKSVAFNSSHGMSIYSWDNMFSSRSDQGIELKQFSQIKFNFFQTTQPMSRYPTRKTIVFLAAIISMSLNG